MGLQLRLVTDRTPAPEARAITIAVSGELDADSAPLLKQGIDRAVAGGARTVTLDLAAVDFIDSSGLGAVLSRHRMLAQAGGRLELLDPTAGTRRLLAITGLDQVLHIAPEA